MGVLQYFSGTGKGDFQAPRTSCSQNITMQGYPPPDFTTFVSFADFNKDGKLDMLISYPADGVEMLLGDGQGNFSSPVRVASGSAVSNAPYFFFTSTVIDFNGDGCPDAAAGDWEGNIFLFAGDCGGNFKHPAALVLVAGDSPAQLSVADINGDGHPDLIASGFPSAFLSSGHMLSVMLSDGLGGFQNAQTYRGGDSLVGFAIDDLNGDGKPDVLAVAQNEDSLYEFLNDGSGGFGAPQGRAQFSTHSSNDQENYFSIGGDYNPLLADINADGLKDVTYIDYAFLENTYSAAVSLNLGAKGFANPVFTPITTDNTDVVSNALGDFHGTGQLDLLVATDPNQPGGPGGTGGVYIMQNLGSGKFGSPTAVYPRSDYATNMFAVDLNGDGKQDLIIFRPLNSTGPQLQVLLGNGNGTFGSPASYPLPVTGISNSANIFSGDFNGDKKTDILIYVVGPGTVIELLGNGNGTLQAPQVLFGSPGLPQFNLFDLNHDGLLDILTQSWTTYTPQIVTYFGQPNGTFGDEKNYNSYAGGNALAPVGPLAGDFNHDGNIDVIVPQNEQLPDGSYLAWAQFYSGNADGTLSPTTDIFDRGETNPPLLIADMDGSGTSSAVEFEQDSTSFHVMKGEPAPPFQLFMESEEIIGDTLQGQIVLNQVASTDSVVTLQVSDPAVSIPGTVTLPAGSSGQTFSLHVESGFQTFKVLTITATLGSYSTNTYAFDEAAISPLTVLAPNSDFGLQPIHTTSPPLTVTVANNTTSPVTLTNIVFSVGSGSPTSDFTETDNCHTALVLGGSCTFTVTFTPSVGNTEEYASLDFEDPISGNVYQLGFRGDGEQAIGALYPSTLSFGSQTVGTVSAYQPASLSNNGNSILNVSNTTISGPFRLTGSCPTVPVGPVGCPLQVAFAPTLAGPQTGTLTITDNGAAPTQTMTLTGTGVDTTTNALQFIPVTPCRIADTRWPTGPFGGPEMAAGTSRSFNIPQSTCGIPSTAVAYSLNVTVVPDGFLSYLTLWPTGETQPYVSTLNSDGRVKANAAITPAGTNGAVSVFVSNATNVILDIDGYFVPAGTASALAFYPVTPCRVADTRNATGPLGGPTISGGSSRSFPVQSSSCDIPSTAKAYSLNVTAVPHTTLGYLTAWATGQTQPYVSTLNSSTGAVTANAAVVPAGTSGAVSIFVSDTSDVILDVNGYFAPPATGGLSLYPVMPCRVIDTRSGSGAFNGTLAGRCRDKLVRAAFDRSGICVERNGCTSGLAGLPDSVAGGRDATLCLDLECS